MTSYDNLLELMRHNRSYRRFDASHTLTDDDLRRLVAPVRYCSSGRNIQALKYRLVSSADELAAIYPLLKWAGYLTDWDGPAPEERPTGYIIQCLDTALTTDCLCDDGLQIEAITLAATACGLGCCIIKAFNAPALAETLGLPAALKPLYVIAVGKPVENVVIEDMVPEGDYKYYRDAEQTHHVPKRTLNEIII